VTRGDASSCAMSPATRMRPPSSRSRRVSWPRRPAGAAPSEDLENRGPIEVRDLPVLRDFLRDEANELEAVLFPCPASSPSCKSRTVPRIRERGPDAFLGPRRGCPRRRGRSRRAPLPFHHGARRSLALAHDGEFLSPASREQALLALHAETVDLVHKEDALVGLVGSSGFDAFVAGVSRPPSGGIVLHVADEGAGVAPCCVDEGWHFIRRMAHEELRTIRFS